MVPRYSIRFQRTDTPVTSLVTKFGGQPVWRTGPQWPLSRSNGQQMMFVGQVELALRIFGDVRGQMAYIFITDDIAGNLPTMNPEGGENAVVIQPGFCEMSVAPAGIGPTQEECTSGLFGGTRRPVEFGAELSYEEDPDQLSNGELGRLDPADRAGYFARLAGSKVGGTPSWIQGPEFPPGGPWKLLLQLESERPLQLSLGDAGVAYAFIDAHGQQGRLLWQTS
jgi:hypothetical protein